VLPTEKWIGLIVQAKTSTSLNGYNSASEFDASQQILFKAALDASIDLITDVSQINITSVDEVSTRRMRQRRGRKLTAVSLSVDYTLTIASQGATSVGSVSSLLANQLSASFNDSTGTSLFATSLVASAQALNTSVIATVDTASTMASITSMVVQVVQVITARPSHQPTEHPVMAPTFDPTTQDEHTPSPSIEPTFS